MRPYQIEPNGIWVDLDTIQSITPPRIISRNDAAMYWQCSFQNESNYILGEFTSKFGAELDVALNAEVERMTKDIFEPFFNAWTGEGE